MTKRLWSINALAVELGMDRRTIGGRLAATPPDGKLQGKPAWHLETALSAINGRRRAPSSGMAPPSGWEDLDGGNVVDQAAFIALQMMLTLAPGIVATAAVERGVVDVNTGPLWEGLVFGALLKAGGDVLAVIGAERLAEKLLRKPIGEAGVQWETFPGFDPAKAAERVAAFMDGGDAG